MDALREMFRWVDRFGRPTETEPPLGGPPEETVTFPAPARLLRVLRQTLVGRDAHYTASVLVGEIGELREQRRELVDALKRCMDIIYPMGDIGWKTVKADLMKAAETALQKARET